MLSADLLALLQRFHELDPQAAHAFLTQRTAVNDAVRNDPQFPVDKLGGTTVLTPLGLLNALCDDGKIVDAVYDARHQLSGFVCRDRVETDTDAAGILQAFVNGTVAETDPHYVRGRPKIGDRVLIIDAGIIRLRTSDRGESWRQLAAAGTRLGVVFVTDYVGFVNVQLGEAPNLTEHHVIVREDELRMHKDDWQARYGQPPQA